MDYLDSYRIELQNKLIEKGWQRWEKEMWVRQDDKSQSFDWRYLVVQMFLGKTPRKNSKRKKKFESY